VIVLKETVKNVHVNRN